MNVSTPEYQFVEDRLRMAKEKGEIHTEFVDLTPALAKELMRRNDNNRRFKEHSRAALIRDINEGRYVNNTQTMSVSDTGILINGQHRVSAVINTGKPIKVLLCFGEPEDAKFTHDLGSSRTAGDFLKQQHHANPTVVASVVKLILGYEHSLKLNPDEGGFARHMVKPTDTLARMNHADSDLIQNAAAFAVAQRRNMSNKMVPAMAGFCHWLLCSTNPEAGHEFMELLATQNGTTTSDPEWRLGRHLEELKIKGQTGKGKKGNDAKVQIAENVVRAYNVKRTRRSQQRLSAELGFIPDVSAR